MTPQYIIVHCSDSTWGSIEELDRWHRERGFKRSRKGSLESIGYHKVITNGRLTAKSAYDLRFDGAVFAGRDLDEVGAHCLGMNDCSLGVCLIGRTKFTEFQMTALLNELALLCAKYNIKSSKVLGHCETKSGVEQGKSCPNLNMALVRSKLMMRGL